jgi:endoglucanase
MRTRVLVLVVALVAALTGFAQFGSAPASAAAAPAPSPFVQGNQLIDARTGATFVSRGANWPSFEYACSEGWGYSQDDDTAAAATAMASWGINTVRLPINENCWLGSDPSDYGTATGYRAAVAAWVNILNAHGMVVILDLHFSAPPGHHALGQWPMADSQSTAFWTSVATAYASDPSIIFDAFNEPYSIWNGSTETFQLTWDCWENGGCQAPFVGVDQQPLTGSAAGSYTVVGMSALVAAIRAGGASQPIMLGGIDYSNNLSEWIAHKPSDSQLIASWHNYDGQNPSCNTTTCWTSTILPVAASVPIVTGEVGETDGSSAWLTSFMTWADSHGIGYLPWAWWDSTGQSGDNALYALFTGPNFTPNAPVGTAYKAHLATLPTNPTARVYTTLPTRMTFPQLATSAASGAPAAIGFVPTAAPVSVTAADIGALAVTSQRLLRVFSG